VETKKNNRKIINAWAMYDWANSVYSLVINSTIFPIYYISATKAAFGSDTVPFLGMHFSNSVIQSYAYSFSYFVISILSPILSGIADYGGLRKTFMKFFVLLGSCSCMGMYFFTGKNIEYGLLMVVLASIGFAGSLVFYNSYLPVIATPDQYDRVSAKGFTYGYIGSVILLIFNLSMIMFPEFYFNIPLKAKELIALQPSLGMKEALSTAKTHFIVFSSRLSFFLTGIWWIGFSQITFYYLPKQVALKGKPIFSYFSNGIRQLREVFESLKDLIQMRFFLIAYFFYNTGVQTVMLMAATFGAKVLNLDSSVLIATILVIQLIAIVGAQFFAVVSKYRGNLFSLSAMIVIWITICISAYFVRNAVQFVILATFVGLVMGGIQSLSRASYSKLIPDTGNSASYFSFLDVLEKVGLVFGLWMFGFVESVTGDLKNSVVPLMIFFIIGLILLQRVTSLKESDVLPAEV
jgi:MFS transporter, UMF1 family